MARAAPLINRYGVTLWYPSGVGLTFDIFLHLACVELKLQNREKLQLFALEIRIGQAKNKLLDAVGKLHDFALTLNVEFNPQIPGSGVIDGFLEVNQGLDDFAREHEADPHAEEQCKCRNYGQYPLGAKD